MPNVTSNFISVTENGKIKDTSNECVTTYLGSTKLTAKQAPYIL
jgi:hypothetical protein